MDKITLYNMKFFGFHGCEDFEKSKGQLFEVDAEIVADLKIAGRTDCLDDAVNYSSVFAGIKHIMENERYNLLERVAHRIAEQILADSRIASVTVRIRKPAVLLSGLLDGVQIEIRRDRLG